MTSLIRTVNLPPLMENVSSRTLWHLFRSGLLGLGLVALSACGRSGAGLPSVPGFGNSVAGARTAQLSSDPRSSALLSAVNQVRARGGQCSGEQFWPVPALTPNSALNRAAQGHAQDMAQRGYFSHTDTQGGGVAARVMRAGYSGRAAGENIAMGWPNPGAVVDAWLASPAHCRLLFSGQFQDAGVGVATGGGQLYWVLDMGQR